MHKWMYIDVYQHVTCMIGAYLLSNTTFTIEGKNSSTLKGIEGLSAIFPIFISNFHNLFFSVDLLEKLKKMIIISNDVCNHI